MGDELWRLVFVNNGVKLAIESSRVLEEMKTYKATDLAVLVCGTCLNDFKMLEKKQSGDTTKMPDIVMAMHLTER
jgi:hypothetical protein